MRVNTELLEKMRNAYSEAKAIHAGVSNQLVDAQRWEVTTSGRVAAAQQRLSFFPNSVPPAGVDPLDYQQQRAEAFQHRLDAESSMRRQFVRAGQGAAFEAHVAEMGRPDVVDFQAALADAEGDHAAATAEVQRIVSLQATTANRLGSLRQSLDAARDYLLTIEGGSQIVTKLRL